MRRNVGDLEKLAAAEFEEVSVGLGRRFGGFRLRFVVNPEAVGIVACGSMKPLVALIGDLVAKAEIRFAVGFDDFVADFESAGVGEEISVVESGLG